MSARPPYLPSPGYPDTQALCERCGYPLRGLSADQACPECSLPASESDPVHRPGLPWQNRMSLLTWLATAGLLIAHPRRSFRQLRLDGPCRNDRLFLASIVTLIVAMWWLVWRMSGAAGAGRWAVGVGAAVVALTYVEVLGVTHFSRRRGWRVPWRLSERVACYAGLGWIPAALVWVKLALVARVWLITGSWWPAMLGPVTQEKQLLALVIALGITFLAFEMLVWLGVRQVRYGNRPPASAGSNGGCAYNPVSPRAT